MAIKNKKQFASDVGVSRAQLYKYIKKGMPISSEEEACQWIALHYGANGSKNLKLNNKKAQNLDSENGGLQEKSVGVGKANVNTSDDSVLGVLARKRKLEMLSWSVLAKEVNQKQKNVTTIIMMTKLYNISSDARLKTEAEVLQMQNTEIEIERRASEIAKEVTRKMVMPVLQTLKGVPSRLARRCNPDAEEVAFKVLKKEIDRICKIIAGK